MRTLLVIGIGAGNPEHMTVQAIAALNRADVLFVPDKGVEKSDLSGLRHEICDRFVTSPASRRVEFGVPKRAEPTSSYRGTVDDWHEDIAGIYEALILDGAQSHRGPGSDHNRPPSRRRRHAGQCRHGRGDAGRKLRLP
jgi:precorrin-6A synthase